MRTLTTTLLSTQKSTIRTPAVSIQVRNLLAGAVNLKWDRLYTGSEQDGSHAVTIAGDGSLVRLRVTPAGDARKLYRQRVTSPGPASDFSQWTYLGQYNVMAAAACSLGAEVSLFWIKSNAEIDRVKSTDNGATWQALDYPGYSPTGSGVTQAAAAYKPNGDLALFFTDTAGLYVIKRINGAWQARTQWDKTTGILSGVAAIYDGDWKLLVSGLDANGNYKIWSLVYGDGEEVTAGAWSALKEIMTAPSGGQFEYNNLFLDQLDTCRCFFSEKFNGAQSYSRPFWSHTLPGTLYLDNCWREPVPFITESANGLAVAHDDEFAWLSSPSGVWRAGRAEQVTDLSADVLAANLKLKTESGELAVELRVDCEQYTGLEAPGFQLESGCQIDFNPGYRTHAGSEYSQGLSFTLEALEYTSAPGKARLILYAADGWNTLEKWTARYQFRWNKATAETSVKEILAQILARAGLKLTVISQSTAAGGFYPDFTIHPGDNGKTTIKQLLSFIPDCLFIEGNTAYLLNPLASDPQVYSYVSPTQQEGLSGISDHIILEGRHRRGAWKTNRVRVEGACVIADAFSWDEIQKAGDIMDLLEDLNLDTVARAQERGQACLRQTEISSASGLVRIAVNCGQQLYDVAAITDPKAGLVEAKRRILAITLSYQPLKGEYEQKLYLGGV